MGRPFITEHTHPDEWMKSLQGHRLRATAHPKSDTKWSIFFEPSGLLASGRQWLAFKQYKSLLGTFVPV